MQTDTRHDFITLYKVYFLSALLFVVKRGLLTYSSYVSCAGGGGGAMRWGPGAGGWARVAAAPLVGWAGGPPLPAGAPLTAPPLGGPPRGAPPRGGMPLPLKSGERE